MKTILGIVALVIVIAQCVIAEENITAEDAYILGLLDGYKLHYLWAEGQTNATTEARYNRMADDINYVMGTWNWTQIRLGEMQHVITDYQLPEAFR